MLETVITYCQLWKLWNLRHVSVGTTYIVEYGMQWLEKCLIVNEKEQTNKRACTIPPHVDTGNVRP